MKARRAYLYLLFGYLFVLFAAAINTGSPWETPRKVTAWAGWIFDRFELKAGALVFPGTYYLPYKRGRLCFRAYAETALGEQLLYQSVKDCTWPKVRREDFRSLVFERYVWDSIDPIAVRKGQINLTSDLLLAASASFFCTSQEFREYEPKIIIFRITLELIHYQTGEKRKLEQELSRYDCPN